MQKFTSANTSINKVKLPAIYNNVLAIEFMRDKKVIDIGGGKYDNAIDHMHTYNAHVSVYDKYNRDDTHNKQVLSSNYDIAVISNVLNVIDNSIDRMNVVKLALSKSKIVLITVYEGNRSGIGKQSGKDSWQENRKTESYVNEIVKEIKGIEIVRKGKLIILKSVA